MKNIEKILKEYYVGRRGFYHNKNVVIMSTYYDYIEYMDMGFDFNKFTITIYYEADRKIVSIKGSQIKKMELYEKD